MSLNLNDFKPKEASRYLPEVDENGISDRVVIFTKDRNGKWEMPEVARYNAKKKLWYSATDPTGFGNVLKWSNYLEPDDLSVDDDIYDEIIGERDE